MNQVPKILLEQLISLVNELREESKNFLEEQQDAQQWYNRGYANGILLGLSEILGESIFNEMRLDDKSEFAGQEVMAWGKAYLHGEEMGKKETYEITSQQ
tara:strand:+ start:1277 stop:1576 length:300 start_codon:yes stop_codon:yes gene_type:complete